MLPLPFISAGETAIVHRIGGSADVKKHLENLGLLAGTSVTVIACNGGNLIIQVKEARIAISREMASHILVG